MRLRGLWLPRLRPEEALIPLMSRPDVTIPALNREPSASQLREIRRLSRDVLGREWPTDLHPIGTRGDADLVIRTLLSAYGIATPGHDPDLLERIKQLKPEPAGFTPSVPAPSPAKMLAEIEKGKRMTAPSTKLPEIEPGQTWLAWAAAITGLTVERTCDACGGTGTMLRLPGTADILQAITGSDSPTLNVTRAKRMLKNPTLDTLRRIADLISGDLNMAAAFVERLLKGFDSNPVPAGRKGHRR